MQDECKKERRFLHAGAWRRCRVGRQLLWLLSGSWRRKEGWRVVLRAGVGKRICGTRAEHPNALSGRDIEEMIRKHTCWLNA